jgi:hypothetical protein
MMFGCVSEHFANLRNAKDAKLVFRALMHYFLGTNVVKHPFYTIGPRMIFGCVSKYFANLRHVKLQNLCFEPECTISGHQSCEASILLHWTQNDVWVCFGAFC